eukprot:TRINITY_DN12639_c0_g3_i2.p1 TRINITY_DN12639_c0_g3~~TRINITY_DN12639_c0_g3_i2.p1  ORF type:complete len:726 (+),score=66.79 TRINITY_DN12639_c0_g3_i2:3212-5389(+)
MYIKEFHIANFRSIEELTLKFRKGVNIIIGENNSGKTAIIDALRICLSYGNMRRDIYVDRDRDFFLNSEKLGEESTEIKFDLIFEPESAVERAIFIDFIRQDSENSQKQFIELHFRYYLEYKSENKVLRWNVWGGENEGQQVPYEALQLISNTYLGALRDATEKLRPHAYGNKIASLYRNLRQYDTCKKESVSLTTDQKVKLARILKDQVENGDWKDVVKTGNEKVSKHIKHSTINGKQPEVEFSFLPYTYDGIVDNIEARKPVYKGDDVTIENQKYFTVSQNGLGENNIIYAGTVLGDLINSNSLDEKEYYYNALLIEEPEAHLHPQKQNTFFEYLCQISDGVQSFITSHSPTITAKADLDHIIILKRKDNDISAFSINDSKLESHNKVYLSKFLDITKSQLFFANGVILVEGISEALLLPVFSKLIGRDLEKNGVEVVNLNGVAFEHFARLFNSKSERKRLASNCSILSDDDNGQVKVSLFNPFNKKLLVKIKSALIEKGVLTEAGKLRTENISKLDLGEFEIYKAYIQIIIDCIIKHDKGDFEKDKLEFEQNQVLKISKDLSESIFKTLKYYNVIDELNRVSTDNIDNVSLEYCNLNGFVENILKAYHKRKSTRAKIISDYAGGNLEVNLAEITFEYEIMIANEQNYQIIKKIYGEMHPDTDLLENEPLLEKRAMNLLKKLYSNKDKSELAHKLAVLLDKDNNQVFHVPNYIVKGIEWVTSK